LTDRMLVRATMVGLATIGSGGRSSVIEILDPLFIFIAQKAWTPKYRTFAGICWKWAR
jgi:hypothetical protein